MNWVIAGCFYAFVSFQSTCYPMKNVAPFDTYEECMKVKKDNFPKMACIPQKKEK